MSLNELQWAQMSEVPLYVRDRKFPRHPRPHKGLIYSRRSASTLHWGMIPANDGSI